MQSETNNMKSQIQLPVLLCLIVFLLFEFSAKAQIQDIKKNSGQNKTNNSNSNNNSSTSNDIGSDIAEGCFVSFFEMFVGCLFSGRDNTENNSNNYAYDPNENLYINPPIIDENQNIAPVDSIVISYKNPENNVIIENQNLSNQENEFTPKIKEPWEYSLDFKANLAIGFEPSKEKTYTYYNFLPGIRANIAWFLIDFRYNILTEFDQDLPDAFKTWDLLFLANLNMDENSKLIAGLGMHREEYSQTTFLEFCMGMKIGLFQKRDYLDIEGRASMDMNDQDNPDDDEFPLTEIGITYNRRFIDAKNLYGYFSVGAMYQNYYSSTDIWAFKAGIILNWHK